MKISKIAVIHLNQIGDLLFSLPLLKNLRDHYPAASIHSILRPHLKDLLADSPYVDEIIVRGNTLSEIRRLFHTVRSHRYDLLISLSRSEACLALAAWSRAGIRAGFSRPPLDVFLTLKETVEGHNSWYNNRKLLNRLSIRVTKDDYLGLLQFHSNDPGPALPHTVAVVSPGASSRRLSKAWDHEKFAALIVHLNERYCLTPVLIGGRDNQEYNARIAAAVENRHPGLARHLLNLTGAGLKTLSLIIKGARLFVGIDSGFMHIASSFEVPLVALFGPTDPRYVGPQNSNSIVVRDETLVCAPCYLKPCKHRECMGNLTESKVFQACEQLLTKSSFWGTLPENGHLSFMAEKIVRDRKELAARIESLKQQGMRIVLTNGGFNLLHVGHVRSLVDARGHGDILVVAVNSDASLQKLKGKDYPIIPEDQRLEIIAALECVDFATLFDEATADSILLELKPHVHAKGTDYTEDSIRERTTVLSYGGKTAIVGDPKHHSSSQFIEKIRKGQAPG